MKSEKKDSINNQETTATQYKKPNQKMINQYLRIYEKSKENNDIKACYIFAAFIPDACVGDESRINKVKRIFFFTAPKNGGFFFV